MYSIRIMLAYFQDPAMRVIVGWQGSERKGASTSEMGRFETETLTQEDNLKGLALMNPQWVELAMAHTPHRRVILDMDSSESPVHGQQEGAAYNGHFECVCYHPLFLFNQFGDCEGATLRSGNVSSADGWQELLEPVVKGYQKKGLRLLFRGDAAFAKPELYEYLEQGKIGYAIRLPANQVIQEQIQPLLERPTEWPSREPMVSYHDFAYQAQSWRLPRRVVAKVEWHQGELFPRVGFIVTNLSYPPKGIVRFYNGRGTAEQWIKEGKYALNWTRLSCHKFVANGLPTSTQLAAFRKSFGTYGPRHTLWMSATVSQEWLHTVDFPTPADNDTLSLNPDDFQNDELERRRKAIKLLQRLELPGQRRTRADQPYDYGEVAGAILERHQHGALTLAVFNTVSRAQGVFQGLQDALKKARGNQELLLVHSRFRLKERRQQAEAFRHDLPAAGRIVVSTQAIEAGVDISARALITDLAPWSSLVQRFGRCNRYGEFPQAAVFWLDLPALQKHAVPYEEDVSTAERRWPH